MARRGLECEEMVQGPEKEVGPHERLYPATGLDENIIMCTWSSDELTM